MNEMYLKACAFCGGKASFHGGVDNEDCEGCHYIYCEGCKGMFDFSMAVDPDNEDQSLEELREKISHVWNSRLVKIITTRTLPEGHNP